MLKVPVEGATARVTAHFWSEGSALAGTLKNGCDGFELELDIRSTAPATDIARLVRVAEEACYVRNSLLEPVPVALRPLLNGEPLV